MCDNCGPDAEGHVVLFGARQGYQLDGAAEVAPEDLAPEDLATGRVRVVLYASERGTMGLCARCRSEVLP